MNQAKDVVEPVSITIFGATGDLAQKKLFPALFQLYKKGFIGEKFHVVGFSRKQLSDAEFQEFVHAIFIQKPDLYDNETIEKFLSHLHYISGDLNEPKTYEILKQKLGSLDTYEQECLNKVFYLAVTPAHYEATLRNISSVGLTIPCGTSSSSPETKWTRVLIEKPFGNNLEGAQNLDKLLGTLFDESQIFRIDHYLTKETLQNILSFRFNNTIFEPIWNKDYIESISIKLLENNIVGSRGESYDPVGALRDVGQNHILQMLALVTMENPHTLKSDTIRSARESILEHVEYHHTDTSLVRAQYKGYREEPGVNPQSETETYFKIELALENDRFRGVPIFIESGKGFSQSNTEITITFKPIKNKLTFSIYPKEEISLQIFAKEPGFENIITPRILHLGEYSQKNEPEAYERVLHDGLHGDHTLFTSTKEVLAEWKLITDILSHYPETKLLSYPVGTQYDTLNFS